MINLNKLDPSIVKIVVEKTAKTAVHKKEDHAVDKDGRHRQQNQEKLLEAQKKIKRINRVFRDNEIGIYLSLRKFDIGAILEILVKNCESDQVLAIIDEAGLEKILLEIHTHVGIILDRKG